MRAGFILFVSVLAMFANSGSFAAGNRPVVLELFTSQGCSSCPPADALLKDLAENPDVLALSYHVNYWDRLGWKDPFSSEESTQRQRAYAGLLHDRTYTPQLIVDGTASMVGSDRGAVMHAIGRAQKESAAVPVTIAPAAGGRLVVQVEASPTTIPGSVWAVRYNRYAATDVASGENRGRRIENIHNVLSIDRLGDWEGRAVQFQLPAPDAQQGVAVMVQTQTQGAILGAASWTGE